MHRSVLPLVLCSLLPMASGCDSPVAHGADPEVREPVEEVARSSLRDASAQRAAIHELIASFHGSLNAQDYDAVLALWTDDATATISGNTYHGPVEIADFVETAAPFVNGWAALAPAYRTRIELHGNRATFALECVFVPDTGNLVGQEVVAHLNATGTLRKVGDRWLFQEFVGGVGPLPSS